MGLRTGGARRVLGGVRVASGWDHLRDLSTRFPGSPAFVDPTVPSSDSSHDPVRWFRRVCPESPVIAYAKTTAAELHTLSAPMVPLATLRYRTDDQLTTIGAIALKYADADAVHAFGKRLATAIPASAHGLVKQVVRGAVFPCSVETLARDLNTTARTLRWRCSDWGLPSPKKLLSLARVYHVHRLAQWSGVPTSVVATALGFRDPCNYRRLVRAALGLPPSAVVERGGPDYVASVLIDACFGAARSGCPHRP